MTHRRFSLAACIACLIVMAVAACRVPAAAVPPHPPVSVQTVSEFTITGSARDSYNDSTANYAGDARLRAGQTTADLTAGVQFSGLTLPAGSSIVSATLAVNISATVGSPAWRIYGEAADNCVNFSSTWPASRTLTAEYTAVTPSGTGWKQFSVTSAVAAIVGRSGWASGNNLCLIVRDNQASNNQSADMHSFDGNQSLSARLAIDYTAPTPTPTHTPAPTATPTATPTPAPSCGQVLTNTTWSGVQAIGCNIAVAQGVTLTIAPGATVSMSGSYKWDVDGALVALGLPTSTITFTSGISATPGSWGPLFVRGSAAMDYVTMTYGAGLEAAGAAAITRSLFLSNSIGVDFLGAGSLVSSTVRGNGVGILLRDQATPRLQADNIVSNTLGLWNNQPQTVILPGLWWGSAGPAAIAAVIRDQADDWRLGPVFWQPAAQAVW